VFPVGGAEGVAWPGVCEPAGALPPAGACCATTQGAQNKSAASKVGFINDIMNLRYWNSWRSLSRTAERIGSRDLLLESALGVGL